MVFCICFNKEQFSMNFFKLAFNFIESPSKEHIKMEKIFWKKRLLDIIRSFENIAIPQSIYALLEAYI